MTNDCSTSLDDWYTESEDTVTREDMDRDEELAQRARERHLADFPMGDSRDVLEWLLDVLDTDNVRRAAMSSYLVPQHRRALTAAIALLSQPAAQQDADWWLVGDKCGRCGKKVSVVCLHCGAALAATEQP